MGYKYEVYEWKAIDEEYCYVNRLNTKWLIIALYVMWKLKRNSAGCVKLEWR